MLHWSSCSKIVYATHEIIYHACMDHGDQTMASLDCLWPTKDVSSFTYQGADLNGFDKAVENISQYSELVA